MRKVARVDKDFGSFEIHEGAVESICELEDGTFVSGSHDSRLKRWNQKGTTLQTYYGHSYRVLQVIELRSNTTIVSLSTDLTFKVWNTHSGECLHTMGDVNDVVGMVRLSNDLFVSGSVYGKLWVWSGEDGTCVETIDTGSQIAAITKNFIVTFDTGETQIGAMQRVELRRL